MKCSLIKKLRKLKAGFTLQYSMQFLELNIEIGPKIEEEPWKNGFVFTSLLYLLLCLLEHVPSDSTSGDMLP